MAPQVCTDCRTGEWAVGVANVDPRTEISVDTRVRVIDMSPEAERMVGVDIARVRGVPVDEAIGDAALRTLVVRAMTHGGPAWGRVGSAGALPSDWSLVRVPCRTPPAARWALWCG